MKKERFFALDFVRVLAAAMIIIFHYNMMFLTYPDLSKAPLLFVSYANGSMGHIGVSLFFILTGASLMYVYNERLELKSYFKKRFLSIYPLYWTVYTAFFVYLYLIKHVYTFVLPRRRLLLTFIGMDGYLDYAINNYYLVGEWFTGCIIIIYILFPLLRFCVLRRPVLTAVLALLGYIGLVQWYPFQMDIQFFYLIRVPEVLFGMYFMKYYYGKKKSGERMDGRIGFVSGVLLLSALLLPVDTKVPYLILWVGIPAFAFLLWVGEKLRGRRVREVITIFSSYSFAVFLVHHETGALFLKHFSDRTLNFWQNHLVFGAYLILVCVLSIILYQISRLVVYFLNRLFGYFSA